MQACIRYARWYRHSVDCCRRARAEDVRSARPGRAGGPCRHVFGAIATTGNISRPLFLAMSVARLPSVHRCKTSREGQNPMHTVCPVFAFHEHLPISVFPHTIAVPQSCCCCYCCCRCRAARICRVRSGLLCIISCLCSQPISLVAPRRDGGPAPPFRRPLPGLACCKPGHPAPGALPSSARLPPAAERARPRRYVPACELHATRLDGFRVEAVGRPGTSLMPCRPDISS